MLYVDLDRFKIINDTLGHRIGDLLLQQVAKRLEGAVRESDTLARPGGERFAADCSASSRSAMRKSSERIREAMRDPFQVDGHELFACASAGLSRAPTTGKTAGPCRNMPMWRCTWRRAGAETAFRSSPARWTPRRTNGWKSRANSIGL